MISRSFLHIKSVGAGTERKLWNQGILCWQDILNVGMASSKMMRTIRDEIPNSVRALKENDHSYFSESLPISEHWRLFKEFANQTAYIDIETTGLNPAISEITTIALYDGKDIKHYVNGKNLYDFVKDIRKYSVIVTFNGRSFDAPFIEKKLGGALRQTHIDLRFVLASLGYSGGLKACEKAFQLNRGETEGIDGLMAVYLWKEYKKSGKKSALDTLLAYNIEDVVNLEYLMHSAYNMKLHELGFGVENHIDIPLRPTIPFEVDKKLVARIKQEYFHYDL